MSINSVIISGNLTRDSELRQTQSGTAILSFGMAVNDRKLNQATGHWETYPNFVDCIIFGKYGEVMQRHLTNGVKVCVAGKLRYSSWEKDGYKRSKLEVVVDEIDLITPKQQQNQQQTYAAPTINQAPLPMQQQAQNPAVYDEQIPY